MTAKDISLNTPIYFLDKISNNFSCFYCSKIEIMENKVYISNINSTFVVYKEKEIWTDEEKIKKPGSNSDNLIYYINRKD